MNSVLSSERDRVTENSVGLCQAGIELSPIPRDN
jgi:hypothetical protein